MTSPEPGLALALGSGAARGLAHIGVLRALEELEIEVEIVTGASMGAVIGAAWLTDHLDQVHEWVARTGLLGVVRLLDMRFWTGGVVSAEKMFDRFRNPATDIDLRDLKKSFGVVACDLASGREEWLREGNLIDAVRASASLPGLFPPTRWGDKWLIDGATLNPVPVSLARAMGARRVIAVNVNSGVDPLPRFAGRDLDKTAAGSDGWDRWTERLGKDVSTRMRELLTQIGALPNTPNMAEVITGAVVIMQEGITRARLAGDPPDVIIAPPMNNIGILDFDRSEELIARGHAATLAMKPALDLMLDR